MDVKLSIDAQKVLEALPKGIHARVVSLLERLARWPDVSGVRRLTGNLAGMYRVRTGDYRVLFRVGGEVIYVETIGHRKNIYEG